jgi:hypothetical protein
MREDVDKEQVGLLSSLLSICRWNSFIVVDYILSERLQRH